MGVDVMMREESLAHCPEAKCRAFRRNNTSPVFLLSHSNHDYRSVRPIENLPFPIETSKGEIFESGEGTEEQYALDITVRRSTTSRIKKEVIFNGWLSKDNYEELKEQRTAQLDWFFLGGLDYEETSKICSSCPLELPGVGDCTPRLFGYYSLRALRRAFSSLCKKPLAFVQSEMETLLQDFSAVFSNFNYLKDNAAEMQDFHQAVSRTLTQEGYSYEITTQGELKLPAEVTPEPSSRGSSDYLAGKKPKAKVLINKLFFRDEEDPDFWVSAEQLALLDSWIDDLQAILTKLEQVEPLTEDLQTLKEVMDTYSISCKLAIKYKLEMGISW